MSRPIAYVTRIETFSAAHRLCSNVLSEAENLKIYDKCYGVHGHNYTVEFILKGPIDPVTGMVFNIADLKSIIDRKVLQQLDHRYLDEQVAFFRDHPSTTENLAVYIWLCVKEELQGFLYEVRVMETDKNGFSYRGELG